MTADSVALAALAYAQRGWRVLPLHNAEPEGRCSCNRPDCRTGSKHEKSVAKHPRMSSWQNDATVDQARLKLWWLHWPRANIGIATGRASDLVVLDVDVHEDKPGFVSLRKLETELGPLPPTLTALTASGGKHFFFRYPPGVTICNSAGWRGCVGIDWRADGGQVVVAPSRTHHGIYVWLNDLPVAEIPPSWIVAHVEYEASRPTKLIKKFVTAVTPNDDELAEDEATLSLLTVGSNASKVTMLWSGNWRALGYDSQSNADLALCSIIAFWCNREDPAPDPDRIDRLFRRSGLMRDKWERQDYRDRTILIAIDNEEKRRACHTTLQEAMDSVLAETNLVLPPPPPGEEQAAPVDRSREAKLYRQVKKIAEDEEETSDARRALNGKSLACLLDGSFNKLTAQARIETVTRAFKLIGFNLPEIKYDALFEMLRYFDHEPSAEDFRTGYSAFVDGQARRAKWEAGAAEREVKRDQQKAIAHASTVSVRQSNASFEMKIMGRK